MRLRLEDHPPDARVDRQPGQPATHRGEPHLGIRAGGAIEGAELLEEGDAVSDGPCVGRLDEGESGHVAEAQCGHLQDDRRQVRAQDLGLGEGRATRKVLLRVEADADARSHPTAPPGPLVGGGLRDGLDRQPLHLGAAVVARDPGRSGIDDAHDPGDGERRLGHVGGQDDAPSLVGSEDAVLLRRREPGVQRHELHVRQAEAGQRLGRVPDLPFTREEHEDVARPFAGQLHDRVAHGLGLVPVVAGVGSDGSVPHVDGERSSRDLDDGGIVEVGGEASRVDRRRRDDHLEVGPLRQELAEVTEQEVDVEAALVRLVDDQHLVGAQHPVPLDLRQQDAVGHDLDERVGADPVVEAHRVPDGAPDLDAELLGDALRDRSRGQPARLGVADEASGTEAELQADLRQLRALARSGLTCDDHHLVVTDGAQEGVAVRDHRQVGVGRDRQRGTTPRHALVDGHGRLFGRRSPAPASARSAR